LERNWIVFCEREIVSCSILESKVCSKFPGTNQSDVSMSSGLTAQEFRISHSSRKVQLHDLPPAVNGDRHSGQSKWNVDGWEHRGHLAGEPTTCPFTPRLDASRHKRHAAIGIDGLMKMRKRGVATLVSVGGCRAHKKCRRAIRNKPRDSNLVALSQEFQEFVNEFADFIRLLDRHLFLGLRVAPITKQMLKGPHSHAAQSPSFRRPSCTPLRAYRLPLRSSTTTAHVRSTSSCARSGPGVL
jgi:hypothetical protein